jgi:MFS family permease
MIQVGWPEQAIQRKLCGAVLNEDPRPPRPVARQIRSNDMSIQSVAVAGAQPETQASWVPMIAIGLGQVIMTYNVASLPVAIGGMTRSFNVPPTAVATGIVTFLMLISGFALLGAKLNRRYGALNVFRAGVFLFGAGQVLMTFSPNASVMIAAQGLCGAASAAMVPSLVALVAENYQGSQQATALGALGSARAAASVAAFLIGGILGATVGWRPAFGILIAVSAVAFILSFRLKHSRARPEVQIDLIGVVLIAGAVILISFGFDKLDEWGFGLARPKAPLDLLGLSPAPIMIVLGVMLGQAFLTWTRRRQAVGKTPLLALEVMDRTTVYTMISIVALEAMLTFAVPLYIQIVQGRSALATALAMLPFNITLLISVMLVVRFFDRLTPRQIGRYGFIVCAAALLWLAFVVRHDLSEGPVVIGLIVFGIGEGALVTLLFTVLVASSPKELAGDVGALRGTANNLAAAVGTALAGALLVSLLSASVTRSVTDNPRLPLSVLSNLDLDEINFVSDDRARSVMEERTHATPEQVAEAVRINANARLRALRLGFLLMAGLALLTIIPAGKLPDSIPGKVPSDPPPDTAAGTKGSQA